MTISTNSPLGAPLERLSHTMAIAALIWVATGSLAVAALDTWLDSPTRHSVILSGREYHALDPSWCGCHYGNPQRKRMDYMIRQIIKPSK